MLWTNIYVAGIGLAMLIPGPAIAAVVREDFWVKTEDGIRIFVRELRPDDAVLGREPIVLLHGARVPGLASFDLPVAGGSLAADLAERTGRSVYVMDARGYGASDRPAALQQPEHANPPQVRAFEVVRDVAAVAAAAAQRQECPTVALLGWATGAMWASYYASLHPEKVGHLITLNALYGGSDRHPQLGPGSPSSDPADPSRLNPNVGAYAVYDAASLLPGWDRSIPIADKSAWRDPAVTSAYQEAALSSDPLAATRQPAGFRAPLGAIEDSFYQAGGRRLFDASSITAPILIVRSDRDFWSRPEDVQAFAHDAAHAASITIVILRDATHYAHLDRPEHGRDQILREVAAFLGDEPSAR